MLSRGGGLITVRNFSYCLFIVIILLMKDVITIGSATKDVFLKNNFEIIFWPSAPFKKAYLIPVGEKLGVEKVFSTIGGNAVNASITFSRQGLKTACLTKIGNDLFGKELIFRLKKEKVDSSLIVKNSQEITAYSVILLKKGERTILNYSGALNTFNLKDINFKKLKSKWWYLSLSGESDKIFKPLLNFAQRNKIAVAFNPTVHHLKHKREEILKFLKYISFLVLNKEEMEFLLGRKFKVEENIFKEIKKITQAIIAMTKASQGAIIFDGYFIYKIGIFKEKKLVDRTGAGDAFGSGFTAGLIQRGINFSNLKKVQPSDIFFAAKLASANATSVVEKIGATEGILFKKDLKNRRWQNLEFKIKKL